MKPSTVEQLFADWVNSDDFVFGANSTVAIKDRIVKELDNSQYVVMHADHFPVFFRCKYTALTFARYADYEPRTVHYFKMYDQRLDLHYRSAADSKHLYHAARKNKNSWKTELHVDKYNQAVYLINSAKRMLRDYKINT